MFLEERKKASFSRQELSYVIYGSKAEHQLFLKRQTAIAEDPITKFDPSDIHESRAVTMTNAARRYIRYVSLQPQTFQTELQAGLFFTVQMPLSLHYFMYLTTLRNLCDEQQVKKFLIPAEKGEMLGCYAQTELGHGSDVQSLMTTATFEEETDSFIIHTPEIKGAKWWVGDLGVYATHACVFAQLIIKNKNYGVHAFVVPIRDEQHKLYPGIQAGDVGPKLGFNNKDNGYAIFTNYRIPRRNMLMKFHRVSRDGEYQMRGSDKVSYATMLIIRATLPEIGFYHFSKGVTILVRYSLLRKQFKDKHGQQIPILNYQTQQQKVLPRISECYALLFCFKSLKEIARKVFDEAQNDKFDNLNEAHALTSSAKTIFTNDILRGLEILRRAAGGHGFLMYSGLPALIQQYSPCYTLEGEYTVLLLQVARFLLKCLTKLQKGARLPESAMYLQQVNNPNKYVCNVQHASDLRNPEVLRQIYLHHSCQKLQNASNKLTQGISNGLDMKHSWDQYANIELVDAAIAHSYSWIYQNFLEKINLSTKNEKVRAVLTKLLLVYGLEKILERAQHYFETGTVTASTLKAATELRAELLAQIRPEALTLVEAFDYSDNTLMSAIGTADGKAYENLMQWAKKYNVINTQPVKQDLIKTMKKAINQLGAKL